MKIILVVLSTLISLSAFADVNSSACQAFIQALPKEYTHGFVRVPENYEQPSGPQVDVFYYSALTAGQTPVLFINGGPALDSQGYFQGMYASGMMNGLSMVFFDQRGTGCSSSFPSREHNRENLNRMAHYGAKEIVKDAEAIRHHLIGHNKWRVLGHSNGSYIIHQYLVMHPEGLKSAHAYGNALMNDPVQWRLQRVMAQKRVFDVYLQAWAGDDKILQSVRDQLAKLPPSSTCFTQSTTTICGDGLIDVMFLVLGSLSDWNYLHDTITGLVDANGVVNLQALQTLAQQQFFGSLWQDYFAFFALLKLEFAAPVGDRLLCQQVEAKLKSQGFDSSTWPIDDCRLALNISDKTVIPLVESYGKSDALSLSAFAKVFLRGPKVPFYLYSGAIDPVVPVANYADEVKLLGSAVHYTNFSFAAHDGYLTQSEVWDDIRALK